MGEPPLMYGIGAYFSLRNAIKAFNPRAEIDFKAPMTPEKTLMALYSNPINQPKEYEKATGGLAINS